MATGQQRRADRLNERLRGAQRANIEDDSFNLDIAGLNIAGSTPAAPAPAPPTSSERRTPNTSAKRRRLDNEPAPSAQAQGSARRRSPRLRDPYDLPETSKESGAQDTTGESREEEAPSPDVVEEPEAEPGEEVEVQPEPQPEPELPSPEVEAPDENEADVELPVLPNNEPSEQPSQRRASRRSLEQIAQDVANKRQDVRMSETISSTTRLHTTLQEDDAPPSSSPLVRKVRRSEGPAVIRSRLSQRRPSRLAEQDEEDELSPNRADHAPADDERSDDATEVAEPEVEEEPAAEEKPQEEEEAAEAIDAVEAAKTIGRKRPRRSLPSQSPVAEPDEQAEEEEAEEPAAKRRRGRPSRSPATQKQPAPKPKPTKPNSRTTQEKPLPKQVRRTKQAAKERRVSDGSAIEVTVQRFVNIKKFIKGDDEEEDHLAADLPFTTTGVTAVDVFAQACLEVIDGAVAKLFETLQNTEEKDKKKECRIKIRALEAYKEELTSRLLQLSIHLMDWQSLRKRVRLVQREKLSLREEILRLKAEREQVALKMDAVRIKHEEDTKESKYRLDTSATMHDIDMAVERGRDAPELSRAQEKRADLANLELLVARITDEASSSSSAGGMLQQVKNFNAFLERAAIALETR
ncbi:hypothetical protein FAGAP_1089 [Fusarium agapanthi]|uniref:Inner kinetochore subunit AME1 domain-containing protein n=1 Tax=Fusarium agapanthi TaxID=1803897 RepID=A0A9P5EI08_9HYPO|nr:hypothetical protein FAGAP_1089 [Fusarium agapanthi]